MYDEYDREWRFFVDENTGTIYRGRMYQTPDDSGDRWRWYWEGDGQVAFYDEGRDGLRTVGEMPNSPDIERAMYAYDCVKGSQRGASPSIGVPGEHPLWSQYDALDRVAVRITGSVEARFVSVPLDRGMVLYMLAWDGDPDRAWRKEVEAVWNGDVWTVEEEEYQPGMGPGGSDWVAVDWTGDEWNGEDYARRMYEEAYPLDEFPADLLVEGSD